MWLPHRVLFGAATAVLTATLPITLHAQIKPCKVLLAEIDAKLKAKGIKDYALEIVPLDANFEGLLAVRKEVGRCDGQTRKIVYWRPSHDKP